MTPNQWAIAAFDARRADLPADLRPEQVADLLTDPEGDSAWDRLPTDARIDAWRHLYRLALRATGEPVNTRTRRRRCARPGTSRPGWWTAFLGGRTRPTQGRTGSAHRLPAGKSGAAPIRVLRPRWPNNGYRLSGGDV